ncbi:MAG TPA: hypothetical protein VGO71_01985 [Baekduia sp.]|nr:hypothetical protein [Baekduia sp.]
MSGWPLIRYARFPLLAGPAIGLLIGCVVAVLAAGAGSPAMGAVAAAAVGASTWWATVVRRKLAAGTVALTREGDQLVGAELPEPLPVAGTTYEVRSDHSGGWLVVLRGPGRDVRLEARGWRLPDGRRTTRAEVATALADLGLSAFER